MFMIRRSFRIGVLLIAMIVTGCAVGPDYHRPDFDVSATYKEGDGWKPSEPDDAMNRGAWWETYHDAELNDLESQVNISNENIKAAAAAAEQAQALLREARSGFWPSVGVSADRQRSATGLSKPTIVNSVGASGDWTLDIWGQIRRSTESSHANSQASEAALAAARLSTQAQLAIAYFQLRAQDQLQTLLNDTVAGLQESLRITQSRFHFGVAAQADVLSAQTQLLASQAEQVNAHLQRALLEHAIAVLVGKQPADFSLSTVVMRTDVPTVPVSMPSTLLERRPDIAQAERKVAAASAQIGVAHAAFFPTLSLTGSEDYKRSTISPLFSVPNRVWAFGPALAATLFDGGLRRAQVAAARAAFDASVDAYRQTVLSGLQQVEDQLVTLRVLEQQSTIEDATVKAAREAETLTINQYKAGAVPYSSVITAQTTRLNNEITALTVLTNRLTASVTMIEALGGGWSNAQLH